MGEPQFVRTRRFSFSDQDIRDHIERETQDNIDRGMAPEEARRQAMLTFGNVALAREDTRAIWVRRWVDDLFGVTPSEPGNYVLGAGALVVVACAAAWLPARRACSIDPAETLRRG